MSDEDMKDRVIEALREEVAAMNETILALREALSDIAQQHRDYAESVAEALSKAEDNLLRHDCEYK
jgi:prefoldin subunit 5